MIKILIYDLTGNLISDPERSSDFASNITWSTAWPRGYDTCTFRVVRRDLFASWAVRESYGVKIYEGATIVFQGRIETLPREFGGVNLGMTVTCAGWHVILAERQIRKRWIDAKAIKYTEWPVGSETDPNQVVWVNNKREAIIQIFTGSKDTERHEGDTYREIYRLPSGTVRRVKGNYIGRTGERLYFRLWNSTIGGSPTYNHTVGLGGTEYVLLITGGATQSGAFNVLFSLGDTRTFELLWTTGSNDTYDQGDILHISNLRVEANYETGHRAIAAPTYTSGQLVEDILLLVAQAGQQLSVDMDGIADPGIILDPFVIEEPTYATDAIDQIAKYGDASYNTWGLNVWDSTGTSDGLPKVEFVRRDVSDYKYLLSARHLNLQRGSYERISSQLYNNVTVGYTDNKDIDRFRTSANNAALADATSIASEYQRDYYLKLGAGDAARADYLGARFISRHKERLVRAAFSVQGEIELKGGGTLPTSRVRAGECGKFLETGEIFFFRQTSYDVESKTVAISPDLPEDSLSQLFLQRERGLGGLK